MPGATTRHVCLARKEVHFAMSLDQPASLSVEAFLRAKKDVLDPVVPSQSAAFCLVFVSSKRTRLFKKFRIEMKDTRVD
jgi:hypothetical protein